jgi:hypothetical protein
VGFVLTTVLELGRWQVAEAHLEVANLWLVVLHPERLMYFPALPERALLQGVAVKGTATTVMVTALWPQATATAVVVVQE